MNFVEGNKTTDLRTFIEATVAPIDYSRIITPSSQVIAFGETHPHRAVRIALSEAMPQLKVLGVTHLGMEALGTDIQNEVDKYRPNGNSISRQRLVEYVKNQFGWDPEGYISLLEAAKKVGIEVVALDLPNQERAVLDQNDDSSQKRDEYMSEQVQNIITNRGNKIVTLTGAGHSAMFSSASIMSTILLEQGVELVTVRVIETDDHSPKITNREKAKSILQEALDDYRNNDVTFIINPMGQFYGVPYHWVISLPRIPWINPKKSTKNESLYSVPITQKDSVELNISNFEKKSYSFLTKAKESPIIIKGVDFYK